MQALRKRTLGSRRARLRELRRAGIIDDDAFHGLGEELDLADVRSSVGREGGGAAPCWPSNQTQAQKISI
jgi:hypothetical protein